MTTSNMPNGIIPPVLTPLTTEQKVDIPSLKALIHKLIDGGVSGLFMGGTAGLGSILTAADYELVIATTLAEVPEDYPVLCGVLEPSTARAVERIGLLDSLGAKFFVTVTPYYVRATADDALLRHFDAQREATDMEMVLYNMPGCTGVNIPAELVLDMTKRGWTASCKDSSGDKDYLQTLCRDGQEAGLKVYQGMCPDFAWLNEIGASGAVPVPSNAYPELFASGWENRANASAIPAIQTEVNERWNELVIGTDYTSGSIKSLAEQGLGTGTLAMPFS